MPDEDTQEHRLQAMLIASHHNTRRLEQEAARATKIAQDATAVAATLHAAVQASAADYLHLQRMYVAAYCEAK